MILHETLRILEQKEQVTEQTIRAVSLTPYFNVVELNDGSVGACMSYLGLPTTAIADLRTQVGGMLVTDPLLLDWLFRTEEPCRCIGGPRDQVMSLVQSLRATVLSALSGPLLRAGGDESFVATDTCPFDLFADARRALVIGFGGYMDALAHDDSIAELHICDLDYTSRSNEMDAAIARYRGECPNKCISISDGHDTAERMRWSDVVAITGSALCNGTLERLLQLAEGGPRVVVQGQSAGIHPAALFRRGVQLVATTLKPRELSRLATSDVAGASLRPLLEGGLPHLFCYPPSRSF